MEAYRTAIADWIVRAALEGADEIEVLAGICDECVLAGNIVSGRATPIRAVVWFGDLTGFTRISDATDAEAVLALLNTYAEAQVEAIEAFGGHVLKFIGDGILAFFPGDDPARACRRALDAATATRNRIDALNAQSARESRPVRDERRRPAAGIVHAGSRASGARPMNLASVGTSAADARVGYSDFRYCARSAICSSDIPSDLRTL
jgi:adenylate cyclase